MRAFKLTEKQSLPECLEIQVEGELDLAVSDRLLRALERSKPEHDYLLIDLDRCEFIDLSALQILLTTLARLAASDRELLVFGARGQVRRLFLQTESIVPRQRPALLVRPLKPLSAPRRRGAR